MDINGLLGGLLLVTAVLLIFVGLTIVPISLSILLAGIGIGSIALFCFLIYKQVFKDF